MAKPGWTMSRVSHDQPVLCLGLVHVPHLSTQLGPVAEEWQRRASNSARVPGCGCSTGGGWLGVPPVIIHFFNLLSKPTITWASPFFKGKITVLYSILLQCLQATSNCC